MATRRSQARRDALVREILAQQHADTIAPQQPQPETIHASHVLPLAQLRGLLDDLSDANVVFGSYLASTARDSTPQLNVGRARDRVASGEFKAKVRTFIDDARQLLDSSAPQ